GGLASDRLRGAAEVIDGLRVGELVEGALAGGGGVARRLVGDGAALDGGVEEVIRQLGIVAGGGGLDGLADAPVEARPCADRQAVVDDLADEGVAEAIMA